MEKELLMLDFLKIQMENIMQTIFLLEPEFRRKGIASSMYNFAEKTLGEIKPSKLQTEDGKLFSESRKKESVINSIKEAKDLLDLDTKDKGNLQRVSDYLDKLDKSLSEGLDPKNLNDVTRVMALGTAKVIVKTLKKLVNLGMTLQQAIKEVSAIHEVEESKIIEALDIIAKENENKSEGISRF